MAAMINLREVHIRTSHDSEVIARANEQAALIRAEKFSKLDIEYIADEVEGVGKSELLELET